MTIKRFTGFCFLLLLFTTACVDEYWPQLNKFENLLVVDGMITNDPGPYIVRLSLSSSVQTPIWNPVTGASIIIHEKNGISEELTEIEDGIYSTAKDGIQGITGHSYRLEIETIDGKAYQSTFEELMDPVLLDSVYALPETRPGGDLPHDLSGLQFYVDTKPAISDSNYLMWNLNATYKYKADLKIRFVFTGVLRPYYGFDTLETCYLNYQVPQIFTTQTVNLNQNHLEKFPLHYVDTETRELYIRYSVLVSQFTLSKEAWEFWDEVRKQNEEQGGLYAQQPHQIRGNVESISNPDESVLGRFTVSGVSRHRIFVDKPDLPFWFSFCEVTETDIEIFSNIYTYPPQTWPVYATTTSGGVPALPTQDCMDCTKNGGKTRKPDYWIDK